MPSLFSRLFRKNGGGPPPEPAINQDLERGHDFLGAQTSTAIEYPSSPISLHLPEAQDILAPNVFQAPTPSREHSPRVKYNDQHGSAVQAPLKPSGPSRIIGYLPRTIYNGSSPIVEPTRVLMMPSPRSQIESNGGNVGDSGPQYGSTLISSAVSSTSQFSTPPFNPDKHSLASQRLESLGILENDPASYQQNDHINGPSFLLSELGLADSTEVYATRLRDSRPQQSSKQASAGSYETTDNELGVNISWPSIQHLPSSVYRRVVIDQEDCSEIANLSEGPKIESSQIFRESVPSLVYPLPNMEADKSRQMSQQALHLSQVLSVPHEAVSSELNHLHILAADVLSDPLSKNLCSKGTSENDKLDRRVPIFGSGTKGNKQCETTSTHEVEDRERTRRDYDIVQSQVFEEMDEYTWSPAASDDGQEALPVPPTPIPHRVPSNVLCASPPSELLSDSHSGLIHSMPYDEEHIYSRSQLSNTPSGINRLLPHINVLISAASIDPGSHLDFPSSSRHASKIGSREASSMLFRYSGTMDDFSSKPTSKTELEEAALYSLGNRMKIDPSMLNWRDTDIQLDHDTNSEQNCREHERNARPETIPFNSIRARSADAGPGSSQTSSSLSTDRYIDDLSGHKASSVLPSSRAPCLTPPLLFGRKAIFEAERYGNTSKSAFRGTISRFDRTLRADRLEETGGLPVALCSLGEQDWETVSAETETRLHAIDGIASNTKNGSSLADNSDSGNLSFSKETLSSFHSIRACPVLQHPAHPRYNYSFMLLKKSQTGELVQVPRYEPGGYLANSNDSSQSVLGTRAESTYQHPSPLRVEHDHPLMSLPRIIRFNKPSKIGTKIDPVIMRQHYPNSQLSSAGLSESIKEGKANQTKDLSCKTAGNLSHVSRDVSCVLDSAMNQGQQMIQSTEQSHQSSAWLSTVSDIESSEPSLPGKGNGDPLTKTTGCDKKAYVYGTPDRRSNREVKSSLADTSSPDPDFSSSPALLASSFVRFSNTPPFSVQDYDKQAIPQEWEVESQHVLADLHTSLARSFSREDSVISISNTDHHPKAYSAYGRQPQDRKASPRRRSSSSESSSRLMDSLFYQEASASNLSSSDGHAQHISSSRLLSKNMFLHSDGINTGYDPGQQNVIERRGRQLEADDSSTEDPATPSLHDPRSFMRNEALDPDFAAPVLFHPVDSRGRPWNRFIPDSLRPRPRPIPPRGPVFQRPLARAESPHLHRIPYEPTPESFQRHILLSRVYLVLSMVIPPIALVYGHGYMDSILRLHTEGKINSFRSTEKTIARCWGYGLSAVCVFAIVITMIIISAST